MDNIDNMTESPWDVVLFPVWIHKKLSVNIKSLVPAFLFVGAFDITFSKNLIKTGIFQGNAGELFIKLIAFLVFSALLGAVDVICTMVPVAEFAVMIGKRSEKYVSGKMPVILMKSYALSHLIFIIPTIFYVYSGIDWATVDRGSSDQVRLLFSMVMVVMSVMPYLQMGVIYRTISVRTRLQVFEKLILILAAFFWMPLTGEVTLYLEETAVKLLERFF